MWVCVGVWACVHLAVCQVLAQAVQLSGHCREHVGKEGGGELDRQTGEREEGQRQQYTRREGLSTCVQLRCGLSQCMCFDFLCVLCLLHVLLHVLHPCVIHQIYIYICTPHHYTHGTCSIAYKCFATFPIATVMSPSPSPCADGLWKTCLSLSSPDSLLPECLFLPSELYLTVPKFLCACVCV